MDLKWGSRETYEAATQEYVCAHCNLTVAGRKHIVINHTGVIISGNQSRNVFYILECPSCNKPTIFKVSGRMTYPSAKPLKTVNSLPENIGKVYDEINKAIAAECYTAAVILARTAINHIAVDKGAEENQSFQYYVKYLSDNHYVPNNAHDWVDRIRQMANKSVHKLEIWGRDDALTIGKFLMYLLIFVYELPNSI